MPHTWKTLPLLLCLVACGSRPDEPSGKDQEPAPPDDGFIFDGDLTHRGEGSCVSEVHQAEALPFDLYVLFDQSGSMVTAAGSGTRLDAVRAAMTDFVNAKESAGMGLGIGYFGNFPIGNASCDPRDYDAPAVPVGVLPANAAPFLASLRGVEPTGETPTGAAVRGACTYTTAWRKANPGKPLDILLLTDGVPEAPVSRTMPGGCDPTLDDAVAATRACAASGVNTFVLGVGPNLQNLDAIAAAGGTEKAFLVDGANVERDVSAALGRIRGTALPCTFRLPPAPEGRALALDRMNVVVTDIEGKDHAVPFVTDAAGCDASGGWHYGAGEPPETVELCPASCEYAKSQSDGGQIQYAVGCRTLTTTR